MKMYSAEFRLSRCSGIAANTCSDITGNWSVDSSVCLAWHQRKHQSSVLLALYERNAPATGGFPSQRTSHVESVSILWRHHALTRICVVLVITREQCLPQYAPFPLVLFWSISYSTVKQELDQSAVYLKNCTHGVFSFAGLVMVTLIGYHLELFTYVPKGCFACSWASFCK